MQSLWDINLNWLDVVDARRTIRRRWASSDQQAGPTSATQLQWRQHMSQLQMSTTTV